MAFHHFFGFLTHFNFLNQCGSTIFNSQINYSLLISDEEKIKNIARQPIDLPKSGVLAKAIIRTTTEEILGLFLTKK